MNEVFIYHGNELLKKVKTNIIPREGEFIWLSATVGNSDVREVKTVIYTVIGDKLDVSIHVGE